MGNSATKEGKDNAETIKTKSDGTKPHLRGAEPACPLKASIVKTSPIDGQKPGTSGLRKATKVFSETPHYLENFIASTLHCVTIGTSATDGVEFNRTGRALLIGGDGRYYNTTAIQTIIKMGVAAGINRFWIGKDGLLSTPAVSAVMRERGPTWQSPFGAFILTASHNPGK
ncbi:MAG: hypothetical protein ACRDL7_14990 [Gaiellaceae bacterium]